jgi:hypothetical protein
MAYYNDCSWMRDSGVRVDHKGRIIISLPAESVDDFTRDSDDDAASIAELMRRDVNLRLGGSKGRRRRGAPKNSQRGDRAVHTDNSSRTSRIGRPAIGAEVRVYVQTSIDRRTREILAENGITLADVFDDCARGLAHASRR